MRAILITAALAACTPPRAIRPEIPVATTQVPGVRVAVRPIDAVSWQVVVRNDRDEPVRVLWDDSAFVAADGFSRGRLVRGLPRLLFASGQQPASPVPGLSAVAQIVTPESLLFPMKQGNSIAVGRRGNLAPRVVTDGVGKIVIAIETQAGREFWETTLFLDGVKRPIRGKSAKPTQPKPVAPQADPSPPVTVDE